MSKVQQIIHNSIVELVNTNDKELDHYIDDMARSWKLDGYKNQSAAHYQYTAWKVAAQIRKYCKRYRVRFDENGYLGTSADAHKGLWDIVSAFDIDVETDGLRWQWRKVDQLRNIRIWRAR